MFILPQNRAPWVIVPLRCCYRPQTSQPCAIWDFRGFLTGFDCMGSDGCGIKLQEAQVTAAGFGMLGLSEARCPFEAWHPGSGSHGPFDRCRFGVGFRLLIRGRRMSSTAGLWAVDWAFSGSHARGCRAQVLPCNITHTKVLILYRSPKVFTKKTGGLCMQ